jgi:hypothetical protein
MMVHRIVGLSPSWSRQPESSALNLKAHVTGGLNGKPRIIKRISQEEEINFDGIGLVSVSAQDIRYTAKLVFTKISSGEDLLEAYVHSDMESYDDDHPDMNPTLKFTVKRITGLPNPLVIAVAMNPGGSDDGWESFAVGAVNGRLQQLTFEHLQINDDGGFFFGNLGGGIGLGAAQYDSVWGEDESHPPPHRYEIKLYKWNGRRFEWEKVLRTRAQYNCAHDGIRALGFHFTDIRATFSDWAYLGDWREMCNGG